MMKDNFSKQASVYAQFRPGYPAALVKTLADMAPAHQQAWDCATGNGQIAQHLANHFEQVWASDISQKQLDQAIIKPNITYGVESAEQCSLPQHSTDLTIVAQAAHWFNFEQFYAQLRRVSRPNAIIALIGYPIMTLHNAELQALIQHFYYHTIHPYWDTERRYVDEHYKTIPFPFREIEMPKQQMNYTWTAEQLIGYLSSWSATQHYIKQQGNDPVLLIKPDIYRIFATENPINLHFDLFMRVGRI